MTFSYINISLLLPDIKNIICVKKGLNNMKYIDLTRTITSDFSIWPNDPPFKLKHIVTHGFVIDNIIQTGMNLVTHIDAAQHMIEGGKSLSQYSPEKFMGRGKLIDACSRETIDVDLLEDIDIQPNDIVFILTGCDKKFGMPEYFEKYPIFTEAFATKLIEKSVKIVGMDSPTPDNYPFPVHKIFLENDVLIIEMLTNLDQLLGIPEFNIIALPPKFDTAGSFIRVIAIPVKEV